MFIENFAASCRNPDTHEKYYVYHTGNVNYEVTDDTSAFSKRAKDLMRRVKNSPVQAIMKDGLTKEIREILPVRLDLRDYVWNVPTTNLRTPHYRWMLIRTSDNIAYLYGTTLRGITLV